MVREPRVLIVDGIISTRYGVYIRTIFDLLNNIDCLCQAEENYDCIGGPDRFIYRAGGPILRFDRPFPPLKERVPYEKWSYLDDIGPYDDW